MTTESFICSKLFEENNFVHDTIPMSQIIVGNGNCRRKCLKQICEKGVYATKFLNCPSYLSKKKSVERRSLGSSGVREKIPAQRLESEC